ncbi:MAG: DUF1365 domain-containing protein [Acidiferrobacterales bacterium]|jgi:DUF1365 family protein|nr:DUF1365 domain-containing protein [Acidiferrobacterales bacterium]
MQSCLYVGQVRHRRFAPREHAFAYKLFQVYLDLDELDTVFSKRWLWSVTRPALARFRREDHLGDPEKPLAEAVRDLVQNETGRRPAGPIRLLTHLRYFGYGFNPVSFFFCFDRKGESVETVVAEVNNTPWGEQHCYVLDESINFGSRTKKRYEIEKQFHVSPFMDLDMRYLWRLSQPEEHLLVHIENEKNSNKVFDATLTLRRREITGASLAGVLIQFPFITMKVVLAIYYEALRLWLKRVPFIQHSVKEEAPHSVKS